jgi:protein-tyrosine phosphatase
VKRVLIVCKGNICRSPTAAVVLETKARAIGLNIVADSAGVENYHVGDAPDKRSIRHAAKRGYDLSKNRARQIKKEDFEKFDLIWAADHENVDDLKTLCPDVYHSKISLFLGNKALPDPYYGEAKEFEHVLNLVEQRVEILIKSTEWMN